MILNVFVNQLTLQHTMKLNYTISKRQVNALLSFWIDEKLDADIIVPNMHLYSTTITVIVEQQVQDKIYSFIMHSDI